MAVCLNLTVKKKRFNPSLKEDWLKNEGGDRFLVKWSFFAFLVCAFHKEPIDVTNFDRSYLEKFFEFFQAVKNV